MASERILQLVGGPVAAAGKDDLADLASRCAVEITKSPPGTVVSNWTAALLQGMWLPVSDLDRVIDLTVTAADIASRALSRPKRRGIVVRRCLVPNGDIGLVGGVPVTTPARTWRDLAADLPLADLVAAGDSVLRAGVPLTELSECCDRQRSRRGARLAHKALLLVNGRSRSRPESHLRVALNHRDLPPFAVNVAVHDNHGQWLAEPDLSLLEAKLALEYQGADHADPERMRRDMTRIAELRRAGWEVVLYGPAEVLRRPEFIAPEIREILRQRAPHLLMRAQPS
jgi:very-short-patch-repair endonuclease